MSHQQHLAELARDRSKWTSTSRSSYTATVDGINLRISDGYGRVAWSVTDGDHTHTGTSGSIPAAMQAACDYAAGWLEQTRNPQHIES